MTGRQRKVLAGAILILAGAAVLYFLSGSHDRIDVLRIVFVSVVVPVGLYFILKPRPPDAPPQDVAEQLARAVQKQCDLDATANQLNEWRPLPLRWTMAALDLADADTPFEPDRLSGQWSEVKDQYGRVPSGRWVVLGGTGSGKSALVLQLMRSLLVEWRPDYEPRVPVGFPLASWNPRQQLHEWMAAYLSEVFPTLRLPAVDGEGRQEALEELVRDRVLPILDGLDQMNEELQPQAIRELSRLDERFPYVLTSRTADFRTAVEKGGRRLTGAALVELQPLTLTEVEAYLLRRVSGSSRKEWADLLDRLDRSHPLAEALSTPLMVWLASASYAHRPAELACWPSESDITDHLLDELIPTVYSDERRWRTEDVHRWLTYLATYVERRHNRTTPDDPDDIAWWRLADAAEPLVSVVAVIAASLTTGGAVGLGIRLLFGLKAGIVAGLAFGLPIGLASARSRLPPTTVEVGRQARLSVGLAAGLGLGLIGGAGVWVSKRNAPAAIWAMAGLGMPLGVVYGLTSPVDVARATSPAAVLKRERIFVLAYMLAYGMGCGAVGVVLERPPSRPALGILFGVVAGLSGGLFNGLPWLLIFGHFKRGEMEAKAGAAAWFRFLLAKLTWLGSPPQLPWRLMTFLEDARKHGVLRQVGAVYQFRHGRLSKRLALRASEGSGGDGGS